MNPGDLIKIDGRPYTIVSADAYGYTVRAPKTRLMRLLRVAGVWRYGRAGTIVSVEVT